MLAQRDTILEGKIFPPLIRFTIPLLLAILVQALYGAVDLVIVGRFGTMASVSAVSNGSQIMHTVYCIVTSLAMGVTVLVGRAVGAKDDAAAAKTVGAMLRFFTVVAVIMAVALFFGAKPLAVLMNVPEKAVPGTVIYLKICAVGMIFIVAFNAVCALFRGMGDSNSPFIIISIACAVNVAGDLLLVGVYGLDTAGAAIATAFAQAVSAVLAIVVIRRGGLPFKVRRSDFKNTGKTQLRILKIGGPIAAQDALVSTSFIILMGIINELGLVASASLGIAEKMFLFLAIVPMSFMSALSAFVAQNMGAKQPQRAWQATKIAMVVSFAFGIIMFCLTYFAGDFLAGLFDDDAEIIASTQSYLRGVSWEYLIIPMIFCFLGFFNGIGKTRFVLLEGLVSSFLFRIPLSYYFSRLPGTNMHTIALAVPLSAVVSLVMCTGYYIYVKRKRILEMEKGSKL
jgi:putative MATE family efflux protein